MTDEELELIARLLSEYKGILLMRRTFTDAYKKTMSDIDRSVELIRRKIL